jgi:hypothetical protein
MIQRYTTPYHDFILPFTVDKVKKLYITYAQNGNNVFEKEYPSLDSNITFMNASELNENASMGDEYTDAIKKIIDDLSKCSIITLHLTQEDTAALQRYPAEEKNIAIMQIRVLDQNDNSYVSYLIRDRIFGTLKEEVI